MLIKRIAIRSYEVGLRSRDGEFQGLLGAGKHWIFDPLNKIRVRTVSKRDPWLLDDQLDVIVKSGVLTGQAEVVDLKDLMNRVTEAKKAAEANVISRREETAARRSQANTAKLLADNPTLMRLRELEVLEKIASAGKMNIVLGPSKTDTEGLADKVMNLL